ncbi:MAG TPA: acyltransferase [Flavisolibacter sp.]|nr:acyltransferase [Flavisolibacter sp.]
MAGTGYIKSLDGVRALAIILVMTFHAELTEYGWIGVQLFFVLSGFLITGILWKEQASPESLGYKFKKFWVRRSLRIFPLYYGYVIAIALAYLLFHFPPYFEPFFPYLVTYTANFPLQLLHSTGNPLFNHLWSLSIEEQFYLLFPLIILLSPRRFTKNLLLLIIFVSPVLRYFIGRYYAEQGFPELIVSNGVNFNTLCQLDAFCTGGIIQVMSLEKRVQRPFRLFGIIALLTAGAGLLSYLQSSSPYSYWLDLGFYHYLTGNYQHVWHYTLLNLTFASFLLALVSVNSQERFPGIRRFLENKWLVKIGRVSYGMYLFHWLIWVYVFMNIFRPETYLVKALIFIPYLVAVYLFSELSYKFYEEPFIKLKDRFFPPAGRPKKAAIPATELAKAGEA